MIGGCGSVVLIGGCGYVTIGGCGSVVMIGRCGCVMIGGWAGGHKWDRKDTSHGSNSSLLIFQGQKSWMQAIRIAL